MSQINLEDQILQSVRFAVGPAFEINYALAVLTDSGARIHAAWKRGAAQQLPASFKSTYQRVGGHPVVWMIASDLYPVMPANVSFDEAVTGLESVSPELVRREGLIGLIHYPEYVDQLISGSASLPEVLGAMPREKHEWLMHIGMYPYDPASPVIGTVERLLADPEGFRTDLVSLLKSFWHEVFADTWRMLQPQMQRSIEQTERLFAASTFAELAATLRLRIEVNKQGRYLQAVRGGARLPIDDLNQCWILPSAFNDKRYWYSHVHADGSITAKFPYFDPSISLGLDSQRRSDARQISGLEPALDPALIFKALGNTTRYAIATLLAQQPRPAAELAKALSLSKATISHHVHLLREAGLLDDAPKSGSVELSLRPATLECLSTLTLEALFSDVTGKRKDTRRNSS